MNPTIFIVLMVLSMLGSLIAFVVICIIQLTVEAQRAKRERRLATARRLRHKGSGVEIQATTLAPGRFHLFLSHVWGTGQDQMRIVKQRLLEMVPDLSVWLDVDGEHPPPCPLSLTACTPTILSFRVHASADLDDISDLEGNVLRSEVVLIFASKGYFESQNCMRELRSAASHRKPLITLLEQDLRRGLTESEIEMQLTDGWRDDANELHRITESYASWGFKDGPGPMELFDALFPHKKSAVKRLGLAWQMRTEAIEWNRIGACN